MHLLIAVLILVVAVVGAHADDIITMPTANQLEAGEVEVSAYYISVDSPGNTPNSVIISSLSVGATNRIEIDGYWEDVDKDKQAIILTGYVRLLNETPKLPDLVVGCKNMNGASTTNVPRFAQLSQDRSYFICAARTVFLDRPRLGPPLVRVHLGLGTADWTLFNAKRHQGPFGGLQFLLRRDLGLVVIDDGRNLISSLSYMSGDTGLMVRCGTFGPHWFAGAAYRKSACW